MNDTEKAERTAKPIIFSGDMIRALLREIKQPGSGKTQTRRVFLVKNPDGKKYPVTSPKEEIIRFDDGTFHYLSTGGLSGPYPCPYGRQGGLLWGKESYRLWQSPSFSDQGEPIDPDVLTGKLALLDPEFVRSRPIEYRADTGDDGPWRSPRFMYRWASRLTFHLTDVRVQRLQDIREAGAKAEGAGLGEATDGGRCYALGFIDLWDSINGKRPGCSWSDNPWCWRLSFRPILANVDAVLAQPDRYGVEA